MPLTSPKSELEELFNGNTDNDYASRRRARQKHNFKRIRLRGDWSDTGPAAGLDDIASAGYIFVIISFERFQNFWIYVCRYWTAAPDRSCIVHATNGRCFNFDDES